MIQKRTRLVVADNSGAREIEAIGLGRNRRWASLGDVVTASVKKASPMGKVKKSEVVKAVIVRVRSNFKRPSGVVIRFDDNAAVLVDENRQPRGTRVLGPVAIELREKGFTKIISLASEVL